MAEKTNNPLFSVCVVTYQSSKYVVETLESIRNQTYSNIELIITDDGSTDDTIKICTKWVNQNKERFANTVIVTTEKNTGIPANCNRGLYKSNGEIIKFIAGDDAFYNNAFEIIVDYYLKNRHVSILQTNIDAYKEEFFDNNSFKTMKPSKYNKFFKLPAYYQHQLLGKNIIVKAVGIYFLDKKCLFDVNGFDEEFKLLEDFPMWLKLTSKGYKLDYLDISTVKYRQHSMSITKGYRRKGHPIYVQSQQRKRVLEKYYKGNSIPLYYTKFYNFLGSIGYGKYNLITRVIYKTSEECFSLYNTLMSIIFYTRTLRDSK